MATPDRVPQELIDRYKAAIDTQPDVELAGGVKLPHTSANGYMYSSLTKDGRLGIRLSKADREAFTTEHDAIQFTNYGANIKEHVEVPDHLLDIPHILGEWLAKARAYTMTLPPKKPRKSG